MQSPAIDLLPEQLGRTTQSPLMTNRASCISGNFIQCRVKRHSDAYVFFILMVVGFFFTAQQEGQSAHRSLELFKRDVNFLVSQHNFILLLSDKGRECF